ncbi:META domain-containing protein [Methyloversatilis discipulorum]|uniref:META domain-containing protein n=1 Tax=Methyloversatilis discipulorum TaxID=1119528 RepID=UPI001A5C172C|nr:META domain-containing protein [Methyloversatilis discipulorum]MBL8469346.1 META domain-containing protein [Methyloversatilis discipulorum]
MSARIASLLGGLLLAACAPYGGGGPPDGRWQIREVGTMTVPDDVDAYIEFLSDGRLAGRAGCNRYTGNWARQGHEMRFGRIAATRMACAGPAMDVENRLFEMMDKVVRQDRPDERTLIMVTGDGRRIVATR